MVLSWRKLGGRKYRIELISGNHFLHGFLIRHAIDVDDIMANITQLLHKWRDGDRSALDELVTQIYNELHRLAKYYLRQERFTHTLQPTALVHEAYLRLVNDQAIDWQNRAHFFGIAAVRMRHILVEHARSRKAAKRGGGEHKISLTKAARLGEKQDAGVLALNDALCKLETIDSQKARVVELRYFAGLTIEETAEVMKISPATVKREWNMARAWLRTEMVS